MSSWPLIVFWCYIVNNKVFIFVIQRMSFNCPQKSIKLISYNYLVLIAYITAGHWLLISLRVIERGFNTLFHISSSTHEYDVSIIFIWNYSFHAWILFQVLSSVQQNWASGALSVQKAIARPDSLLLEFEKEILYCLKFLLVDEIRIVQRFEVSILEQI